MRLHPIVGWLTADRYQSKTLPPDCGQRDIDAAVCAAADKGGRNIAVRFCDDDGRCRHITRYERQN
jgi:hypothetical protein